MKNKKRELDTLILSILVQRLKFHQSFLLLIIGKLQKKKKKQTKASGKEES